MVLMLVGVWPHGPALDFSLQVSHAKAVGFFPSVQGKTGSHSTVALAVLELVV